MAWILFPFIRDYSQFITAHKQFIYRQYHAHDATMLKQLLFSISCFNIHRTRPQKPAHFKARFEAFEVPRELLQQKSKTVEAILRLQEMLQQLEKFRR